MVTSATSDRFEGSRRFLIFAPSEADDRFDGQLLCLNDVKEGFLQRGLTLYEIVECGESRAAGESLSAPEVESLRMRYGVPKGEFLALLLDSDGVEVTRWNGPVPPNELFRAADEHARTGSGGGQRQLLLFSPSSDNPAYILQSRRVVAARESFAERDLVLGEVVAGEESRMAGEPLDSSELEALRERFGVGDDEFAVVLIGKDGTEKRRWSVPAEMGELFAVVDSMPMRQREMEHREPARGS